MEQINNYSVEKTQDKAKNYSVTSLLYKDGVITDIVLDGVELKSQFVVDTNIFLILSDTAMGETLFLYLLDSNGSILDEVIISGEYGMPALENLKVISSNEIEFSFLSIDDRWLLTVLKEPKMLLPTNPFGIITRPMRYALSKQYLIVEQLK